MFMSVVRCFSHVQFFAALWTIACQASLPMGFSRQEWECATIPFSRGSSRPRGWTQPLRSLALAGRFFTISTTGEAPLGDNMRDFRPVSPKSSEGWDVVHCLLLLLAEGCSKALRLFCALLQPGSLPGEELQVLAMRRGLRSCRGVLRGGRVRSSRKGTLLTSWFVCWRILSTGWCLSPLSLL